MCPFCIMGALKVFLLTTVVGSAWYAYANTTIVDVYLRLKEPKEKKDGTRTQPS
jgi:hypothetical protein